MSDSKNRQWILAARPTGILTGNEFRWNEAPIPQPADGQLLVRNLWLSFDPTQRALLFEESESHPSEDRGGLAAILEPTLENPATIRGSLA